MLRESTEKQYSCLAIFIGVGNNPFSYLIFLKKLFVYIYDRYKEMPLLNN